MKKILVYERKKFMSKKLLSLLTGAIMTFSTVPFVANAEETTEKRIESIEEYISNLEELNPVMISDIKTTGREKRCEFITEDGQGYSITEYFNGAFFTVPPNSEFSVENVNAELADMSKDTTTPMAFVTKGAAENEYLAVILDKKYCDKVYEILKKNKVAAIIEESVVLRNIFGSRYIGIDSNYDYETLNKEYPELKLEVIDTEKLDETEKEIYESFEKETEIKGHNCFGFIGYSSDSTPNMYEAVKRMKDADIDFAFYGFELTGVDSIERYNTIKNIYTNGDANNDGETNMADAVMIMQSLANPNKYGINGTHETHITSQGEFNGDMDGNGLTNADALEIQKMLLKLS